MNDFLILFSQNLTAGNYSLLMLLGAFLGGILASVSPCSLAMLPIIVGYVGGYSNESPARTLLQIIVFVIGTGAVFSAIGILCALGGKVFVAVGGEYFLLFVASLLLVMGLKLLGILDFELPVVIKQMPQSKGKSLFVYPLVLGMVFALAGTPCSTPILAGIMGFASLSANTMFAILLLFLFSLGQGLILVIAAVFTSSVKNLKSFAKVSDFLLRACGLLLALSALYIFFRVFEPVI